MRAGDGIGGAMATIAMAAMPAMRAMPEPETRRTLPDSPALPGPRPALSTAERLRGALSALPAAMAQQLRSGRDLIRAREAVHRETPLPTSCPALDTLLDGGLERGQLTELVGGRGSGRFGVVLSTLAAATAAGEVAALLDLGDHLDLQVAQAAGCALERLLWVRPERLRDALAATEMALQSGFVLIVLELGCPPLAGGRGSESAWVRLQRAAAAQGCALLVSSPYRVSGTAAGTVLRARGRRGLWAGSGQEPRLLAALDVALELEKSRRLEPRLDAGTGQRQALLTWRLRGSLAQEIAVAALALRERRERHQEMASPSLASAAAVAAERQETARRAALEVSRTSRATVSLGLSSPPNGFAAQIGPLMPPTAAAPPP